MKKPFILALALLAAVLPLAAGEYTLKLENYHQEGPVGSRLDKPFIILLKDRAGRPLAGQLVESVCINHDGKAKVLTPAVRTDARGMAAIWFKNGEATRQYEIRSSMIVNGRTETLAVFKAMAFSRSKIIFYVLGGLALFLFGMKLLSDGLQTSAGTKMKSILAMLTRNKYMGVLVGFIVTAVLQSSSVTTVMLIGFVNAGLMTFTQTIGVILGADIGTTMTGFIISLNAAQIMFPILIVGFLLHLLGKTTRVKYIGLSIIGLGLIFLGLETMSQYVKPLKDSVTISNFFIQFSTHPFLAIIAGVLVTCIIQSSSATLGLIITLGTAGLIGIEGAFGLVLGANIGTTITAQLASIGGSTNAKRVAMTHTFFKVAGVTIIYLLMQTGLFHYYYDVTAWLVGLFQGTDLYSTGRLVVPAASMALFIAFLHAIFNILLTLIFLPFTGPVERLICKLLPAKKEKKGIFLEPHLLDTPAIALDQTVNELSHMLQVARKMVKSANEGLFTDDKKWEKFGKREDMVDSLREDVIEYLVQLTQRPLSEHESIIIPKLIHAVNDIERIGDLSENIMEQAIHCRENRIRFTAAGRHDLERMHSEIEKMIELTLAALKTFDVKKAQLVLDQENVINELEKKMRNAQIKRVNEGHSKVPAGISFLDIITNLERIGDHLTNIADAVIFSHQ